jgi:hypothetical protein
VFKLYSSGGELTIEFAKSIDWRLTSYSLLATVSDGVNTSAPETLTVTIPNVVNMCFNDVIDIQVPKENAGLALRAGGELGRCKIWE